MQIWKRKTKEELEEYRFLKYRTVLLEKEAENMEYRRANGFGGNSRVQSSGIADGQITAYIDKAENLRKEISENRNTILYVEEALNYLSERDRYILEVFYIKPQNNPMRKVREKYYVSDAQVYRYLNSALINYYRLRHGHLPQKSS